MSRKDVGRTMYVVTILFTGICCLESAYPAEKAPESSRKTAILVVRDYTTNKGVVLMKVRGFNDLYAKLLKAEPDVRAVTFTVMATTLSGYSPLIIRMFLGDKTKTAKSRFLQREGRVCDFACDALDKFYKYPFGRLPANATEQDYDKQIAKWIQWFDKTVDMVFGPKGGPLRGIPEPDVRIGPESEPSQDRAAAGKK